MPSLSQARGACSALLLEHLRHDVHELPLVPPPEVADALTDDDLHLALYLCYEIHYRGLPGVDERWEWEPSLLAARKALEEPFEAALRGRAGSMEDGCAFDEMDLALRALADADDAPSLSSFVEREATVEQLHEFLIHRSAYQLKEADPHSWAIPRLAGPPKAALVEIQADEYGGGRPERVHARLFADAVDALGLDS